MSEKSHTKADSASTLPPLSPIFCKFTCGRTLARSLISLTNVLHLYTNTKDADTQENTCWREGTQMTLGTTQ